MKIAAYNVENLFDRAKAFNEDNEDMTVVHAASPTTALLITADLGQRHAGSTADERMGIVAGQTPVRTVSWIDLAIRSQLSPCLDVGC